MTSGPSHLHPRPPAAAAAGAGAALASVVFTEPELAAVAAALAAQGTGMSRAALSAARKVVAAEPEVLVDAIGPGTTPAAGPGERLAEIVPLRPHRAAKAATAVTAAPGPTVDDEIRAVLERAVHDRRVVRLVYADGRGRPSDREVEPAGLLAAAGRWHLVGWCRARQEGRGFRLDRIIAVKITSEPVVERPLADVLGPLGQSAD